jgi:hypothetical protein
MHSFVLPFALPSANLGAWPHCSLTMVTMLFIVSFRLLLLANRDSPVEV